MSPKFDAEGLLTCVATDARSGDVLMVAHMNAAAMQKTIATGEAVVSVASIALAQGSWSRGALEMRIDCDQDAVWIRVEQEGSGACATGRRSCFYRACPPGKPVLPRLPPQFRDAERRSIRRPSTAGRSPRRSDGLRRGRPRKQLPGPREMRAVVHYPTHGNGPLAGIGVECGDDGTRLGDCVCGRREHLVDDRHLRRMDRHFSAEAVAARLLRLAAEQAGVAEVRDDRIERPHLCRRGAGQA